MRRFPRPRVVISACLEFDNVRYDGKVVSCPVVGELKPFVDFIKVCPESAIGLGVPRDPLRIVNVGGRDRLIQPRTGRDVTDPMDAFTDRFLASLPPVDGFLFKSGSPTIGFYNVKVYDYPVGPGVARRTSGLFAQKILRRYYGYPLEDDLRMRNGKIRDEFLTKLYAFAGLREAAETGDPDAMSGFQDRNRCLFMCYDQDARGAPGDALARGDRAEYSQAVRQLLSNPRTPDAYAGVALRIFERYGDRLSSVETAWFHELVAKYRNNKVSRDGLLEALELFAVRMSDWQTTDQTLFAPYPLELVPDADPERDMDYRKAVSMP